MTHEDVHTLIYMSFMLYSNREVADIIEVTEDSCLVYPGGPIPIKQALKNRENALRLK